MQNEENPSQEQNIKDLKRIPSIGNLTVQVLIDAGFDSVSKLKKADLDDLASIDHIGENLARNILKEVRKGSLSDHEKKETRTLEFRCPVCDRFTLAEEDKCRECKEPIELISGVILPDRGMIEDPKKTLAKVEENILKDGGDAESWFIRGSILESIGANRKALESFDRVIELDPLFDYVWNAKANVSLKIGDTEEAAKAYILAFDAHKAPKDITLEIEEEKTSREITELKEKDEVDEELDDKISKARELLEKLDEEEKDISEITADLDVVIEEKIEGNKTKALEMVDDIIKKCQRLSDTGRNKFEKDLEDIEEIIDKGEEKGFDLEMVKKDFDELKKRFESEDKVQEEMTDRLEEIKQKGENILSLRSNISKIEDLLSKNKEYLSTSEYEEGIEEIEDLFKEGNSEKAIERSRKLKKDVETEIKKAGDKEKLESKAETNLAKARKKLSELRETNFDIKKLKKLLKNSNEARKEDDLEKSITLTEKFIDSADKMIELSEIIEKVEKKIEVLDEKNLVDKDRLTYEIDQYKKLTKVEKYELAEEFLSETFEEIEEALEEENMIPPKEYEMHDSAAQIPTQIKEKVRNVKELNNLVERAEIEIEVNRKPLKKAIIMIKDLKYEKADQILTDWKKNLIDILNYEINDRLETLQRKLDDLDLTSAQRRGKAILENIERKWNLRAYEEALDELIYASNFINEFHEKNTKMDKQIYLFTQLIEDFQGLGDKTEEFEELLSTARENKENEELFKKTLEEMKEKLRGNLTDIINKELKELEDRLQRLDRKKVVMAISNLIEGKSSLDEGNTEKASWYMREYKDILEKG
ncbi:MAG: hypothetical protein KGY68_02200 [Candidatus Thermoplasmatota archaeon]|nr:hypothetical protein [Candidatus Thermoplasmatota archaeon]